MTDTKPADPSEVVHRYFRDGVPSEVFEFRRHYMVQGQIKPRNEPVRIQLLTLQDEFDALKSAQEFARHMGEVPAEYGDIYKESQAVEIAWRCMYRVNPVPNPNDDGEHFVHYFASPQQLRETLRTREIGAILSMYEIVKAKYGALESFMDEGELDKWVARLSDEVMGGHFLARLDSQDWPQLIFSLASRVATLSQRCGVTLPSWHDSLDSDESETSAKDTGSSSGQQSELPASGASSTDGIEVEGTTDPVAEARRAMTEARKPKPDTDD